LGRGRYPDTGFYVNGTRAGMTNEKTSLILLGWTGVSRICEKLLKGGTAKKKEETEKRMTWDNVGWAVGV